VSKLDESFNAALVYFQRKITSKRVSLTWLPPRRLPTSAESPAKTLQRIGHPWLFKPPKP
jgi:hypothetical protein